MNEQPYIPQSIMGFSAYSEEMLHALKADLSLDLGIGALKYLQKEYSLDHKTPTVGELRFFDKLAKKLYSLPVATHFAAPVFENDAHARIWQDVTAARGRQVPPPQKAPDLMGVLDALPKELARLGRTPFYPHLVCHTAAEVAVMAGGSELPTLTLGDVSATLMKTPRQPSLAPGLLLLALSPEEGKTLAETVTLFCRAFATYRPLPLFSVGEEGLGLHFTALGIGLEFNPMYLENGDAVSAEALPELLKHRALFAVSPASLAAIKQTAAPITVVGRTLPMPRLVLKQGLATLLDLPMATLAHFPFRHYATPTVPALAPSETAAVTLKKCPDEGLLLGGVAVKGSVAEALGALTEQVFASGGSLGKCALAATLSLPPEGEATGLALALELHRFAAELSLPLACRRVLPLPQGEQPTLTLFLAAKAEAVPEDEDKAALGAAVAAGDLAAIRQVIYRREIAQQG